MRISLLIKREPFGDVVSETLTRYFSKRYGKDFSVKWRARPWMPNGKSKHQTWYCNPYINAIFNPKTRADAFKPVINEFTASTRKWLAPIQKAYVAAASQKPFRKWLASYQLEISPSIQNPDRYLILGGNHHIRMLDVEKKLCHVICKSGFENEFLIRDVETRNKHSFLPAPEICESSLEDGWYCEKLISGTPINRIADIERFKAALDMASSALEKLYGETSQNVLLGVYSQGLCKRIYKQLESSNVINEAEKKKVLKLVLAIENILVPHSQLKIETVQSHGDFQPANILAGDSNESWLIDWEYTGRRQADYDGLVFSLGSRFPEGLGERVRKAFDSDLKIENPLSESALSKWNNRSYRKALISLFLMEEIELRLMEHTSPKIRYVNTGFHVFVREAERIVPLLV